MSKIETKYILFFFEDFIIKNKVELSIVDSIFEFIKVNNIDYLKLNNTERKLINITDIINTNLMLLNNVTKHYYSKHWIPFRSFQ